MTSSINGFFGQHRWLSNFWLCPVKNNIDGRVYGSAEAAYQASKADPNQYSEPAYAALMDKFARANPKGSKRMSYSIHVRHNWDSIKVDVMTKIVRAKFNQNSDLGAKLVATKDVYLEETNTWKDTFWGVYNGKGQNQLGKILMKIRAELQQERSRGLEHVTEEHRNSAANGTNVATSSDYNNSPDSKN